MRKRALTPLVLLLPFLVMLAAALMLVLQVMVDGRKGKAYSD